MDILLTCGVGDFIALESLLTDDEKNAVENIYWASRAKEWIHDMVDLTVVFPNLKEQFVVFDDWASPKNLSEHEKNQRQKNNPKYKPYAFITKNDVRKYKCKYSYSDLADVKDFSIKHIVDDIAKQRRTYGDTFLNKNISSFKFDLCGYVVIHPFSNNMRNPERDMNTTDWDNTIEYLKTTGLTGVVVNDSETCIPCDPEHIVDLSQKLTINEIISVLKNADGFIGCASVFSVMASKILKPSNVWIKATKHVKNSMKFYYAPNHDKVNITNNFSNINIEVSDVL